MTATYSPATIKRCKTILSNAQSQQKMQQRVHKAATRAVVKDTIKRDWRTKPASDAQIRRINGVEKFLGYKPSTRRAIGNAGQASDLFQSLKAEAKAL
jgi:hypothetical protein